MLEDLMRVHDVERVIVNVESVEVAYRELDIRTAAGVAARLLDHVGRHIDAEDPSGATLRPISAVMVPGPHPRSSTLMPSVRRGAR